MHGNIHPEMTYRVIQAYPNKELLEFLLLSMARPDWSEKVKTRESRIEWLKKWMDAPDDSKHGSTARNDYSYKLRKQGERLKLVFGKGPGEQATVVARLKYAARDLREWTVEEEPRICGLELAMCMHWVVDLSSPPHMYADCDQKLHDKIEDHFDKFWKTAYTNIESTIKFGRKDLITDVYKWVKNHIECRYDQNVTLMNAYKSGKTMLKDSACESLSINVVKDIAQNLADFLTYAEKEVKGTEKQVEGFTRIYDMLQKQVALYR